MAKFIDILSQVTESGDTTGTDKTFFTVKSTYHMTGNVKNMTIKIDLFYCFLINSSENHFVSSLTSSKTVLIYNTKKLKGKYAFILIQKQPQKPFAENHRGIPKIITLRIKMPVSRLQSIGYHSGSLVKVNIWVCCGRFS